MLVSLISNNFSIFKSAVAAGEFPTIFTSVEEIETEDRRPHLQEAPFQYRKEDDEQRIDTEYAGSYF